MSKINPSLVHSYGNVGPCKNCYYTVKEKGRWKDMHYITEEMAMLQNGEAICKYCVDSAFKPERHELVRSDAELKCPAKNCDVKNLSWREYGIGKCCAPAMVKQSGKDRQEYVTLVMKNLNEARAVEPEEKLEWEKKYLEWAKKDTERMEASLKTAYIGALREMGASEDKEEGSCDICFEGYDKQVRRECTLLCGHRYCLHCLTGLKEKFCPTCRIQFTNEQIIKLF
ncbi:Oidioi.mRNA.OKI2018_I69.XSR.g15702.t1.cds [Oikopleura dioica]|uniref:Oidioi.mRNA.OKI2018_I69.XSR.g15702.t1.cds n=1 Tax=Oikopleura dioica TaxID=34765 RepID=A0ABN7SIS2_OIKDI|nr:Oidioi.mRNA.OKI2018_I69.XSR.g15702.t1.cds [Oikopleura dioica]